MNNHIGHAKSDDANPHDVSTNYIIGIGINSYKNYRNLYNCVGDVKRFIKTVSTNFEHFHENRVITLFNEGANKSAIEYIFEKQLEHLSDKNNLIIYFAGHCHQEADMGYLIPHGAARFESFQHNTANFISFKKLLYLLDGQAVQNVLLIIDSCYTGKIQAFYRSLSDENNTKQSVEEPLQNDKSAWVLASGDMDLVSKNNTHHSPFCDTLIHILERYADSQHPISTEGLHQALTQFFPNNSELQPILKPLNAEGYENSSAHFVFTPKLKVQKAVVATQIDLKRGAIRDITGHVVSNRFEQFIPKKTNWAPFFIVSALLLGGLLYAIYWTNDNFYRLGYDKYGFILPPKETIYTDDIVYTPTPNIVNIPSAYGVKTVKRKPKSYATKSVKSPKFSRLDLDTDVTYLFPTDIPDNIVLTGNYETKAQAAEVLKKLQALGYNDAQIVMHDKPYAIVVTNSNVRTKGLKSVVQSLKKRGIEAYVLGKGCD